MGAQLNKSAECRPVILSTALGIAVVGAVVTLRTAKSRRQNLQDSKSLSTLESSKNNACSESDDVAAKQTTAQAERISSRETSNNISTKISACLDDVTAEQTVKKALVAQADDRTNVLGAQSPEGKSEGKTMTTIEIAAPAEEAAEQKLESLINHSQVMLFMKGTPESSKCESSGKILRILETEKIAFGTFDILSDENVRQGLKRYSNWPTYPQLYSNGKLIGGLDIVKELHEDGILKDEILEAAKDPKVALNPKEHVDKYIEASFGA